MSSDSACNLVCDMLTCLGICFHLSSKGARKGKCLFCIPVEHVCLGFGILTSILNGLVLLYCIVNEFRVGIGFVKAEVETDPMIRGLSLSIMSDVGIPLGIILAILGLASLIGFIFSVLLCIGICNRCPGQVKSYFVYGVVVTVLIVLAAILQLIYDDNDPIIGVVTLFGVGLYTLVLLLVYQTYTKLRITHGPKKHMRLVEEFGY